MEVQLFLDQWQTHPRPPPLEKVKALDEGGCNSGNLKALGNAQVDGLAKQAADGVDAEYLPRYADAVQVHDATSTWIMDIAHAVSQGWWEHHRTTGAARRMWLLLYAYGVEIDWRISNHLFRPPTVEGGKFVHAAPPPLLKWTARARTGALATRFSVGRHKVGVLASLPLLPGAGVR